MPKNALRTVQYAQVEITPHWTAPRGRSGPALPTDWPQRYLDHLAQHATMWRAAKEAGISTKTVERLRAIDPAFADAERDAIREHAEHLEERLDTIAEGSDMPAVTACFGRLKKLLPHDYVEKNLTVTASVNIDLGPDDGKALLQAMLGAARPSTVQALTTGEPTP